MRFCSDFPQKCHNLNNSCVFVQIIPNGSKISLQVSLLVDIGDYFFFLFSVSRTYFSCFSMYWELKSTFSSSQRGMWSDIWSIL